MLPVTSAMDVRGVEVTSIDVMSTSWSCPLSSSESTPNLMLSGTKSATAVSVFPGVDVLLTYQDSGRIFLTSFPYFVKKLVNRLLKLEVN
jgi:hypothetical protein